MRVRSGRLELWEDHWQRLVRSASDLRIACAFEADVVLHAVKVLAKDLPKEAIIKLSLLKEGGGSKLYVYARSLTGLPDRIGLLLDCPWTVNQDSPLAGHKNHNYLEQMLVLDAAHAAGCYDALRVNTAGRVAEGAISNLFFHRDGVWHTPTLRSGLLPGVVRGLILQLMPVEEGEYLPEDILAADAVFLSNSVAGLIPVDFMVFGGTDKPVFSRDQPCFSSAVGLLADSLAASAIEL